MLTGWLCVALLAATPADAGSDAGVMKVAPPFAWDVPGQLELVPVGERLERDGLPLIIFLARSKWKLGALLDHYQARFVRAGYFIPPRQVPLPGLELPRVVALDDVKMVSLLVYGWPEEDGTTTLVLGAADLGHRRPTQRNGLPVFPAAKHVTTFDVELGLALSFTAKASEAEIIDFYRTVLPSGGWKEREPGTFVRAGRAVKVLAKRDRLPGVLSVVVLEQFDDAAALSGTGGGSGSP